jgi:hypothetical protein
MAGAYIRDIAQLRKYLPPTLTWIKVLGLVLQRVRRLLHALKLLLPALIPAWNFFDEIAASPRIEYTLLPSPDESAEDWREFRPRPPHVPLSAMLGRLFWNARGNETLFVVSCAERLLAEPTAHSQEEIFRRIAADVPDKSAWLRFRIFLVSEQNGASIREMAYISDARRVS